MHDSVVITQGVGRDARGTAARWLLLIHQIPPKPDYFRVKVRRRLDHVGAVALKNSVYVLPNTEEATEDFQWLRRLVVDEGGEATLCVASFLEGMTDGEVEQLFLARSDDEYGEIVAAAGAALGEATDAVARRLDRRLAHVTARDFFGAAGREEAERAVKAVHMARATRVEEAAVVAADNKLKSPHGANWVTRSGVRVDRIASAWLIRRFIDRQARFKFVPPQGYRPETGELRFDMFEGEFTHEGEDCTFEVLVGRYVSDDAALRAIAEIVHDIDCKDEKFGRPETPGIASLITGIAATHGGDPERVAAGAALFDELYAAFHDRTV